MIILPYVYVKLPIFSWFAQFSFFGWWRKMLWNKENWMSHLAPKEDTNSEKLLISLQLLKDTLTYGPLCSRSLKLCFLFTFQLHWSFILWASWLSILNSHVLLQALSGLHFFSLQMLISSSVFALAISACTFTSLALFVSLALKDSMYLNDNVAQWYYLVLNRMLSTANSNCCCFLSFIYSVLLCLNELNWLLYFKYPLISFIKSS